MKNILKSFFRKCWHNWQTIEREIITGQRYEKCGPTTYNHSEYIVVRRLCVCKFCGKRKVWKL